MALLNMDAIDTLHDAIHSTELLIGILGVLIISTFGRRHLLRTTMTYAFCGFILEGLMHVLGIVYPLEGIIHVAFLLTLVSCLLWELMKLREYNKLMYFKFLNSLPDLIWVKDHEDKYTYINDAGLCTLFKCNRVEVLGKTDEQLFDGCTPAAQPEEDICRRAKESDDAAKKAGKSVRAMEVGRVGDRTVALQVIKTPLYDGKGRYVGIIAVARDLMYDVADHAELERLYKERNYEEFEKLFEEHKFRYLDKPDPCG